MENRILRPDLNQDFPCGMGLELVKSLIVCQTFQKRWLVWKFGMWSAGSGLPNLNGYWLRGYVRRFVGLHCHATTSLASTIGLGVWVWITGFTVPVLFGESPINLSSCNIFDPEEADDCSLFLLGAYC
ncbi:hypothetical protein AVEN_14660-1 [Araneus ventricosus]|uniref:Uncharacterized protein n=1 Tax=Araneus ventricosus TaxID=182803 RepID=A0A4Y2PN66_ARAVE|nr:hypothetical protein AVEN_178623-1 [Araneus ventricosus]GBN52512.1 hypothetical protein AVEN_14660-1 [Araneus ventricosus]